MTDLYYDDVLAINPYVLNEINPGIGCMGVVFLSTEYAEIHISTQGFGPKPDEPFFPVFNKCTIGTHDHSSLVRTIIRLINLGFDEQESLNIDLIPIGNLGINGPFVFNDIDLLSTSATNKTIKLADIAKFVKFEITGSRIRINLV